MSQFSFSSTRSSNKMATSESARKKNKTDSDDDNNVEYTNESVYANKGKNHTIEHVYFSLLRSDLRTIHWRECVLSSPAEELVEACVVAEKKDCLSTVFLATSDKDWGTITTEAQLAALKAGQSAQVMDDAYIMERMGEDNDLERSLLSELDKDELQIVLENRAYRNEAMRRLRAVEMVISGIPPEERTKIMDNDLCFQLLFDKIRGISDDPRRKLVEKVTLFHWVLRANPSEARRFPLV